MIINVIGNKGGIGKTTISAYLAEYFEENNRDVIVIDTDPENKTFLSYGWKNGLPINLKDENDDISKSGFDDMLEIILNNKDKDIIIDNGAGSFNALINYFPENEILALFEDENIEHTIVGIVAGGGNAVDSLNGLNTILGGFDSDFIVFNNELLGTTELKGTKLQNTKVIENHKQKIKAIIDIPKKNGYMVDDIIDFTKLRKKFGELKHDENLKMMQKRRLVEYKKEIFEQLDKVFEFTKD